MTVFPSSPPRRIYERNPLKLVVCQLRFPVLHEFDAPGFLAPFQAQTQDEYPRSSLEQQIGFAVGPGGAANMPAQPQYWRFRGLEDSWSVALGREFVSLETTKYERFESFRERLLPVLSGLEGLGVRVRERLGLRYVNEIRHEDAHKPADWTPFVEPKLLGMVGGPELGENVIHAVTDIRLRDDEDVMVLRHGYVGPQDDNERSFYLLDIDTFDERPTSFDRQQTTGQIERFHEKADSVWESSITDKLREHLGVC